MQAAVLPRCAKGEFWWGHTSQVVVPNDNTVTWWISPAIKYALPCTVSGLVIPKGYKKDISKSNKRSGSGSIFIIKVGGLGEEDWGTG